MDSEKLREEIERLGPWLHAVELAPGISTGAVGRPSGSGEGVVPQVYSAESMMRCLIGSLYPAGMAGRSFLDCGCNAGGHMFAAVKLGAGRCFGFDARQHWIDQGRFLARHLPSENVDFGTCELADLPGLGLEPFDVTLFSGLFYHLPDPVAGLKIAADLTKELIVVNTSALPRPEKGLMLSRESETHVLSGVDGLAWLPTGPEVVQEILAWCGFPHSRVDMEWLPAGPTGWRRIQVLAARGPATFADYDRARPDALPPAGPGLRQKLFRRLARRLHRWAEQADFWASRRTRTGQNQ